MLFLHARAGTFARRRRVLQRRAGSLLLSIALGLIIRIIPAIAAKTSATQFKNARHLRQQLTVMGGHQYTALITGKLVVEPCPALPVQVMICGPVDV